MTKIKYLLLINCLLCTACDEKHIYISSVITQKWNKQYFINVWAGTFMVAVPQQDYYFMFNEQKPYTKKISKEDYTTYEIGNTYTFEIDEKEQEYFFEESITIIVIEHERK